MVVAVVVVVVVVLVVAVVVFTVLSLILADLLITKEILSVAWTGKIMSCIGKNWWWCKATSDNVM